MSSARALYNGNVAPSVPSYSSPPSSRAPAARIPPPRVSTDSTLVGHGSDVGHAAKGGFADVEKGALADKSLPPPPDYADHAQYQIQQGALCRQLKSRHIAMISIGGAIGTGLFIGTGRSLATGGPLGTLLAYAIMGSVCWSVMTSLGEMISHIPVQGGMITLAARFADPALAIAMGWNYWYCWTTALPAELSAAAVVMDFWSDKSLNALYITLFLLVVLGINLGGARWYGEMEFWFASIKVVTIVALILFGVIADLGGNPKGKVIGFSNWQKPGPFAQFQPLQGGPIQGAAGQFAGFFAVLIQASFSFVGTEISAIAAGEAQNPKRNLPRAVKKVYLRIILFYVCGVLVIGLLVPSNNSSLISAAGSPAGSPFVIAATQLGVKVFPHIINACLLTSAWSAASSDLYTASRALYGLALSGGAPRFLAVTNSWGLPWICVVIGVAFGGLAYLSVGGDAGAAGKAFDYLSAMTSTAGLMTWWGVQITYLRWWKGIQAQQGWGVNRKWFPYRAPWQPYTAWYGFIVLTVVLISNGWTVFIPGNWSTANFITAYLPLVMFGAIYGAYKFWNGTTLIQPSDMDFDSNSRDVIEEDEPPAKNAVERAWRWLM